MNSKWYISTLAIVLTFLGLASQQQVSVPNQEIVLQFNAEMVSSDAAQNAIVRVKKQLHRIGVERIQVIENEEGILKITYYSDTDAESVKKILSKDKELGFASFDRDEEPIKLPSDKNSSSYNLEVFEIHSSEHSSSDLVGNLAIQQQQESNRFVYPNFYIPFNEIKTKENDIIVATAYNSRRIIALAINQTSYAIPAVRAGPMTLGNLWF